MRSAGTDDPGNVGSTPAAINRGPAPNHSERSQATSSMDRRNLEFIEPDHRLNFSIWEARPTASVQPFKMMRSTYWNSGPQRGPSNCGPLVPHTENPVGISPLQTAPPHLRPSASVSGSCNPSAVQGGLSRLVICFRPASISRHVTSTDSRPGCRPDGECPRLANSRRRSRDKFNPTRSAARQGLRRARPLRRLAGQSWNLVLGQ